MIKPEGRGFNSHPGKSFSLSLCGLHSISRADAHMVPVYMGRKLALHITLYRVICSTTSATLPTFAKKLPFLVLENNIHLCTNGIKLARVNAHMSNTPELSRVVFTLGRIESDGDRKRKWVYGR